MVEIDRRAVTRGALWGLAVIAPVSIGVEVLDAVDVLAKGPVVFIPALAIFGAFFLAGFTAAKPPRPRPTPTAPWPAWPPSPPGSPCGWPPTSSSGNDCSGKEGDTTITVVLTVATVALLSMSGGIAGGLLAARDEGRSS